MLQRLKTGVSAAVDLFLPRRCRLCGSLLTADEQHICTGCKSDLSRSGYAEMLFNPMEQRFTGCKGVLAKAVSPFFYEKEGGISHLIHALKYKGIKGIGEWLGRLTARELFLCGWFAEADFLVPVPLHKFKKWQRGFNQSYEICRGISAETGIPILECLQMCRWQSAQARRGRQERWQRRQGIYRLMPGVEQQLQGMHLIVVDDVCTTGSTLQTIVQTLGVVPNIKVSLLTVAVAH